MKKYVILFVFSSFILFNTGCKNDHQRKTGKHLFMAVLYQQRAAECKALYLQAYNMAGMILEKDMADTTPQKRALVFDIDETVLDNSPFEAKCALEGISYPEKWNDWCNLAKAKALPGAVEFINDAYGKGVAIFYISNRKEELREATKKNLLSEGLPLLDDSFLMMKKDESSKESRRQQVLKDYRITMLFGDNLADFADCFDNKTMLERDALTDSLKKEFGKRFIVFPNAMYGDWEGALYNNNYKLSENEKNELRKTNMISF